MPANCPRWTMVQSSACRVLLKDGHGVVRVFPVGMPHAERHLDEYSNH